MYDAEATLTAAMHDRVRRAIHKEPPPDDEHSLARVLLRISPLCTSIAFRFDEPDRMTFELDGVTRRSFAYPPRGRAVGSLRSLLGYFGFIISEEYCAGARQPSVSDAEWNAAITRLAETAMRESDFLAQPRQLLATDYAHLDHRDALTDSRTQRVNLYGFRTVLFLEDESGHVPFFIETFNRGIDTLYLYIRRLDA